MVNKATAPKVATKAAGLLNSSSTGKNTKAAAGSALAQVAPAKVTSAKAATAASQVLRDGRTSAAAKSAAGSTLAQRAKK